MFLGQSTDRFREAGEFITSVADARVRAGLTFALTTVLTRRGMNPDLQPSHDFDLRFYLEAVKAMLEAEVVMRAIVEGRLDELSESDEE